MTPMQVSELIKNENKYCSKNKYSTNQINSNRVPTSVTNKIEEYRKSSRKHYKTKSNSLKGSAKNIIDYTRKIKLDHGCDNPDENLDRIKGKGGVQLTGTNDAITNGITRTGGVSLKSPTPLLNSGGGIETSQNTVTNIEKATSPTIINRQSSIGLGGVSTSNAPKARRLNLTTKIPKTNQTM